MISKLLIKFVHCHGVLKSCCINLCVISMKEYKLIYVHAFFLLMAFFFFGGGVTMCIKELNHNHLYF